MTKNKELFKIGRNVSLMKGAIPGVKYNNIELRRGMLFKGELTIIDIPSWGHESAQLSNNYYYPIEILILKPQKK